MANIRRLVVVAISAVLFFTTTLTFSQNTVGGKKSAAPITLFDRVLVETGVGVGALPGLSDSTGLVLPITASYVPLDLPIGGMEGFVSAGVRWEPGLVLGADSYGNFAIQFMESFTATGDFYLRFSKDLDLIPFAGLGIGLYQVAGMGASIATGNVGQAVGNFFGFAPRIGVRFDGINGYISYNIIAQGKATMNPSYLSIVAGYTFGGKRLSK